jgi:hypothetical protein
MMIGVTSFSILKMFNKSTQTPATSIDVTEDVVK